MHYVHSIPSYISHPLDLDVATAGSGDGDRSESSKPKSPIKTLFSSIVF